MTDAKEHRSPYEAQFPGLFRKPAARESKQHEFSGIFGDGQNLCAGCGISWEAVLDNLAPKECSGVKPVDTAEQERIWQTVRAASNPSYPDRGPWFTDD